MKQKIVRKGDACSRSGTYIILSCLPVLLVLAIAFLIVFNADFELCDDHELLTICMGKPFRMLKYAYLGRFSWSRSEYNFLLLTPFNDSPVAFYAVSAVQYLVFSLFTFLLLRRAMRDAGTCGGKLVLLGIWLTLHFGTHETFFCLVQPERLLITLLSAFSYFFLMAAESCRRRHWAASLTIACVATYCKEPVFGAMIVMGVLVFLIRRSDRRALAFSLGLLASSVLYITLYVLIVLPKVQAGYRANGGGGGMIATSVMALRNSPLLAACILLALPVMALDILLLLRIRPPKAFSLFCFDGDTPIPHPEDVLLLTGAAYSAGIILLGGTARYYFYPTLMLSFPALLLYARGFLSGRKPLRMATLVLAAIIPAYYAHYTAGTVIHRVRYGHRDMDEMKQLARIIGDGGELIWYDKDNFKDIVINWKAGCLPVFINYINGTDSFVLNRAYKLPSGLSGQSYVISWDEVPEYEAAAYPKLPVTMFHVYYGRTSDD